MKKLVSWILASVFAVSAAIALSACSKQERITVAIPNDTTNEARALLLLQENGLITLKEGAGITATIRAGANAITYTPPSSAELFAKTMADNRSELE